MSVCAVMLVKDEADIIGDTLRHLLGQVDYVIVADNGSTDGTRELLASIADDRMQVIDDPEVGYFQDRKTTDLARHALARGFRWVLPCDADEFWYAADGRPIRDFLAGVTPDVQIVTAPLYNHIPSAEDDEDETNPFRRIGWRKREHGALPKVCVRARPDVRIHMGNHGASFDGTAVPGSGLIIRHYSWRSATQYLRKIRNGERAYAATDMPEGVGAHWRMFAGATDDAVRDHFYEWFYSSDPHADPTLIYDPAPGMLEGRDAPQTD